MFATMSLHQIYGFLSSVFIILISKYIELLVLFISWYIHKTEHMVLVCLTELNCKFPEVCPKGFYLFLYAIALKILSLSPSHFLLEFIRTKRL